MSDWLAARLPPWRPGPGDWLRIVLRGAPLFAVTYGCLVILLLVRLVERPLCGQARPVTPYITRFVCRSALRFMGLRLVRHGQPMRQKGAVVANHATWLDIFVLNACDCVYFVAKSEVAGWPGIGWLARATGTVFIARKGAEAKDQAAVFEARLKAGHRLLFFPEGTSTDALRVLPFKSTLFAAFFAEDLRDSLHVQPVSVVYHAPKGQDARLYGWWGDMEFGSHLARILAQPRQGRVEVTFHPPVAVSAFPDRKALAQHCERVIRSAHDAGHAAG
ncbi:MAG: 1-acyl-sn-glycerol-3-phosphate acyltransferase [Paracoccaceae bacterium]|nr:MAG: 1-acyl-sn-glycerol-3-phosphate acyltransferase [Paracoccaceae bacterium]